MKFNKLTFAFFTIAIISLTWTARAQQTTMPPLPLTAGISTTNPPSPLQESEKAISDGYNILKGDSFTNGFTESTLFLYQNGDMGFVEAVSTDSTNSLNYGFFVGGLETKNPSGKKSFNLYDGGIAITADGSYNLPLIGLAGASLNTGAVMDLSNPEAGAFSQSTVTIYKMFIQSSDGNISIGATGGAGYSTLFTPEKPFYLAGLTITDRLKGKGFLGLW